MASDPADCHVLGPGITPCHAGHSDGGGDVGSSGLHSTGLASVFPDSRKSGKLESDKEF